MAGTAWPVLTCTGMAHAQSKPPVLIGWLMSSTRERDIHRLNAFKEGMAALGWKEGVHYVLEERWAQGQIDRLPALAAEIAARKPVLIVAAPSQPADQATKAAPQTPVVQANGSPLAAGLVKSLARPGGMVTDLTNVNVETAAKTVELLRDALPGTRHFGYLRDITSATGKVTLEIALHAAKSYALKVSVAEASSTENLETALTRLAKESVQALVIGGSAWFTSERQRIVKFAMMQRWPVFDSQPELADAGALATYGADRVALFRRSAYFVDRILKGAKPADLPIEQPTKFETVVNLKTTKALGLTIPQSVMVRADRVIE